ncbi:MAG: helix-turn-helix domain-containing protein, partial [Candidatus Wallbacteria bacterium]|nr:helix-turn-helix domain-containing protein [Candidatus Wallbacteria bacterium]
RAAAARIESGCLNEGSVDELAEGLGVTARHLRRAMVSELGVSPVELAQTVRLALAKQLLHDTALPIVDVAFAAGFESVRRFNALFQSRFGRSPGAVRRAVAPPGAPRDCIVLRLDFRPPFDWQALLGFLGRRALPGVETVEDGEYRRTVCIDGKTGWVAVSAAKTRPALLARVSLTLATRLVKVVARLRALFDLNAQPALIDSHLGQDPLLAVGLERHPGLRVPGAFDGFELAVRAVLGQQVSVRGAVTLCGRLARAFGQPALGCPEGLERIFPAADVLAQASLEDVRAIGLPQARARAIVELARAVLERRVALDATAAPEAVAAQLRALPGLGDWTASYVTMRALGWPDAFPAGDLALRKALGATSARAAEELSLRWQPWRAYAAMHLWTGLTEGGGP